MYIVIRCDTDTGLPVKSLARIRIPMTFHYRMPIGFFLMRTSGIRTHLLVLAGVCIESRPCSSDLLVYHLAEMVPA